MHVHHAGFCAHASKGLPAFADGLSVPVYFACLRTSPAVLHVARSNTVRRTSQAYLHCNVAHPAADVFQASLTWQGPRAGFFYGTGQHGSGYYKDTQQPAPSTTPAATAMRQDTAAAAQAASQQAASAAPAPAQAPRQPTSDKSSKSAVMNRQESGVTAASAASPAAAAAAAAQQRAASQQQVQRGGAHTPSQQQAARKTQVPQIPQVSVAPVKAQLIDCSQEVRRGRIQELCTS